MENDTALILKKLRCRKGLSLEQLAHDLNERFDVKITIRMLENWENGKINKLRAKKIKALAIYYNVTMDFILGFDQDEYQEIINFQIEA